MNKTPMVCALFALLMQDAAAQTPSDTIPFTLNRQHNICIKARVNDSDTLTLMFHSSSTGVTLTKKAVETKVTLAGLQSSEVTTWGGRAKSAFSENNRFTINRLHWDSLAIFVNDLSGEGTDGKFGHDLFAGKILEIDYDHHRMIVHSKLPKIAKRYHKTALIQKDGSNFLQGTLKIGKQVYRDTFMFHTGYGGAVLLDPKIGERYGIQKTLTTIKTSEVRDAYGNVFKIDTKLLPNMRLAGQKIQDVPLSFAARSSEIPMKVFGNGLLMRFNVVFDFQKSNLYLRPNGLLKTPFG